MGKRVKNRAFSFSAVFRLSFLLLQLVPLTYYGVTLAMHHEYMQAVEDVGATVSPLTMQAHRWASVLYGDPGATQVVRFIATGVSWEHGDVLEPFQVENYVRDEHEHLMSMEMSEETDAGRMVRIPRQEAVHISALGLVVSVKGDGTVKARKIHDYSRPFGESINAACEKHARKFATLEDAYGLMRPGYYLGKLDLSKAYRFVGVAPELWKWLVCEWQGSCYMDTRLAMGLTTAPQIFHDITQAVGRALKARGVSLVVYLDDFLIVGTREECQKGLDLALDLVRFLGFEVAEAKLEGPVQRLTFLGVVLDTNTGGTGECSASVSKERLQTVGEMCETMAFSKKAVRVRALESLIGKLSFCAQVMYGARTYLRRAYDAVSVAKAEGKQWIHLSRSLSLDLKWWKKLAGEQNGRAVMLQRRPVVTDFFSLDASTGYGMGGFFDGRWFSVSWNQVKGWKKECFSPFRDEESSHINYLELYVIYYALWLWGPLLVGCTVVFYTDNTSALAWSGKFFGTRTVIPLLKEILRLTVQFDVRLAPQWIGTKENILADLLSRGKTRQFFRHLHRWQCAEHFLLDRDDWKLVDPVFARIEQKLGLFDVEACADVHGANAHLRHFWSVREDCRQQAWRGKHVFCNPPFSMILEILQHFLEEKRAQPLDTAAVFVLPFWTDYPFWRFVLKYPGVFQVQHDFRFPAGSRLFTSPTGKLGERRDCGPTRWAVVVVRCPFGVVPGLFD